MMSPTDLKKLTTPSLLKQRSKSLAHLEKLDPFLIRGSLIERYKRCGKPGCKCSSGKGHGPKYYLVLSVYKSKPDVIYVPLDQIEKVKDYLEQYQTVGATLKQICDINRELLRRGELT